MSNSLRLPAIHLVFGLTKRWLLGTHHGAVLATHLPAYLDEFVFRFNRRTATNNARNPFEIYDPLSWIAENYSINTQFKCSVQNGSFPFTIQQSFGDSLIASLLDSRHEGFEFIDHPACRARTRPILFGEHTV